MKNKGLYIGIVCIILLGIVAYVLCQFPGKIKEIEGYNLNVQFEKGNDVKAEHCEDFNIKANIPIFMYHWLREDTGGYEYPENMVKPTELRKQMEYLKENNYDVIFVSEIDKLQHYEKPVILTFDDGWVDVYYDAFPLAKEFNMKICMYVITDFVGTSGYCTIDQLKEMNDSGLVEIDSHTLSHPYLDTLSSNNVNNELVNSKKWLKDNLGIDSKVICYPSGRKNQTVVNVAKENYKYGLLMDGGVFKYNSDTSNMYEIERIYAMRTMNLNKFISYCENSYVKVN